MTKFQAVKRPGREFDNSTPTGAEVMKVCSCKSITTTCLHGVDRKSFIFVFMTKVEQDAKYAVIASVAELHVFASDSPSCPVLSTCKGQLCLSYDLGFHRLVWQEGIDHT